MAVSIQKLMSPDSGIILENKGSFPPSLQVQGLSALFGFETLRLRVWDCETASLWDEIIRL
ncbi:Hypothetical predicted protein [Prunus dulcis]|uniref:Uncharacterized protein n=1 Tax=Prunus dulcis TaxID=3755 RepID=A0A5E4FUB9_PRUDU|nr:Hypothetical predicted protein [Prunus dulcis]